MTPQYDHRAIEAKWQHYWAENKLFQAEDFSAKPQKYVLVEFPYPSGDGLHVGHCRSYTALDILARKWRMEGNNVLYPMGWDAFGLPTENYAIKTGIHPAIATKQNTDNFRRQMKSLGFSFDWSREINTTDPNYYRWTQWIFLRLFQANLAYKAKMPINWCLSCKIGLANEEVIAGACERCGAAVEQRQVKQWLLKITAYADKLLDGLDQVDFPSRVKEQQRNWIGRKEGINITYPVKDTADTITCFTTRPDTNFGATFIVLAPEHKFAQRVARDQRAVATYIARALHKTERERQAEGNVKTGVFTGFYAINQLTKEKMPIWVSDFVLGHFGTGAVVGVPGHDKRDFAFAHTFKLSIKRVVIGSDGDNSPITTIDQVQTGEGVMVNSAFLNGLNTSDAIAKIMDFMVKKKYGQRVVTYSLRDWVFSRQHYWGEPIPIINCDKCGLVPVPAEDLPVMLPQIEQYEPTTTGQSPLANLTEWVNTTCPACGGAAKRETDTMPNWAGSSWYFLRYADPNNNQAFASQKLLRYWLPVDVYNGGMEHTTLHLLYSRFWHRFLFDQGLVPNKEPYQKRTSHGVVLGEGGGKMSKSRGNVVNPDGIVNKYGADTLRVYEMFMGPFSDAAVWSTTSLKGSSRFLQRVWAFVSRHAQCHDTQNDDELNLILHRTIKRVTIAIEQFSFNTAVAALMEMLNAIEERPTVSLATVTAYVKLLSPFAPHLAEELWQKLGYSDSIIRQPWPQHDEKILRQAAITIPVQVNGKVRGEIKIKPGTMQTDAVKIAREVDNVTKYLQTGKVIKVIYIPDKLLNYVVR